MIDDKTVFNSGLMTGSKFRSVDLPLTLRKEWQGWRCRQLD